jgi:hypothetical protein
MRSVKFRLLLASAILSAMTTFDPALGDGGTEIDSLTLRTRLLEEQTDMLKRYLPPDSGAAIDNLDKAWAAYRDAVCAAESVLGMRVRDASDAAALEDARRQCLARLTDTQRNQVNRYLEQYVQIRSAQEQQQRRLDKQQADAAAREAACTLPVAGQDFDVLAVGTYKGFKQLDVPIGRFAMLPRQADVVVNSPRKPVILVLMAYDPTVWNVKYTPDAKIIGVVLAGYHQQAILGIAKSIAKVSAIYDERGPCRSFYAYRSGPELMAVNERLKSMIGREITTFVTEAKDTTFIVGSDDSLDGKGLMSSADYSLSDYANSKGAQ